MRYRLRTLLIVLALGPPLLAVGWWKYSAWRAEQERQKALREWTGPAVPISQHPKVQLFTGRERFESLP